MAEEVESVYLGFDLSTQSCKGVIVDETCKVRCSAKVTFDADLPHYSTQDGVLRLGGGRVVSPPAMWAEGLDLCLQRLMEEDKEGLLKRVTALSGSGQQHGTVYWSHAGLETLSDLDAAVPLKEQLQNAFIRDSPIWMDSSSTQSCRDLEQLLGSSAEVARRTGSAAFERFSVHLIRSTLQEAGLEKCAAISLVSSFAASLLKGSLVPPDWSDGGGMNLMSLLDKRWDPEILRFAGISPSPETDEATSTEAILPQPVPPWTEVGNPSAFWQKRGLPAAAKLIAWSGDNPSAVVGLGLLREGDLAVSLGTSDTVMAVLGELPAEPIPFGHLFPHPLVDGLWFYLLCYTNGDLARRHVKDEYAKGCWETFSEALMSTRPLNSGCLVYHALVDEITPPVQAGDPVIWRGDSQLAECSWKERVRGAVEMRALAMRVHLARAAESLAHPAPERRLLLTGGASANTGIRQVFADIFQRPVTAQATTEAAAVGAALRAMHAVTGKMPPPEGHVCANPAPVATEDLDDAMAKFQKLEASMMEMRGK